MKEADCKSSQLLFCVYWENCVFINAQNFQSGFTVLYFCASDFIIVSGNLTPFSCKRGKKNMRDRDEIIRVLKFLLFSVSAGIIQLVSFTILNEMLLLNYWVCYLTALVLSVLWNFTLNRKFTFKSANNVPVAMVKVAAYYAVFTPLSTWGGDALAKIGWNEYIVLVTSMLLNFATEFLYDRFFVFGGSINTAVEKTDLDGR